VSKKRVSKLNGLGFMTQEKRVLEKRVLEKRVLEKRAQEKSWILLGFAS